MTETPSHAAPATDEPRHQTWLVGALPLAFWTLIALLHWVQISVAMHTHGHVWWRLLAWTWALWGSWGLFTWLVLRLGRRFRLERPLRLGYVALHAAAALGVALLHLLPVTAAMVWLQPYAPVVEMHSFWQQYLLLALDCLHVDFLIYWAVLGGGYTYEYRERLRERELRASELREQLARAQLEALQLQIHPHFLFNALNSVAALVRKHENQAALKVLDGLGELLRYVLDSAGTPVVSLERELAFIARYVEIQQARFSDRLTGRLDAPLDLLDAQVPTLILQPLVENAIEHGIARVGSPGVIEIEARADAQGLRICVRDNGPGPDGHPRHGIGLANTRARLRKLYGGAGDVVFEQTPGGSVVFVDAAPRPRVVTALRALIVDDEPLARDTLRGLLQADAEIAVAGECGSGAAAVSAIRADRPDIVFLDVQLPDMNGFEVLEQVVSEHVPVVVFVTAYDRYAIQAFDVHAVDYLLKPFDDERFARALRRAKRSLLVSRSEGDARLAALLDRRGDGPGPAPLRRLAIPSNAGLVFVRTADVDWIEAADYYVQIHVGTKVHLLREPMTALEGRLDAREFVRVHRSAIVNIDRVRELRLGAQGHEVVLLQDGTELRISRRHRKDLRTRLR